MCPADATNDPAGRCALCGRACSGLTLHHLIPRTRHRNKRNQRDFDRQEVRERTIDLCRACHKQVHAVLDEKQLEREYNTLDSLRAHPEIARFVKWVRKQPADSHVTVRRSRSRRSR